jgi:hypothetical protein
LTFFQEYAAFWGPGTTVLPGSYRISLSTTARAVGGLDYILESNVGPDSTVIFNGNLGGLSVRPSFTITAPVPFTYDPRAGNLLLDIVVENQAMTAPSTWGANDAFFTHYNNGVTSRAFNLGVQATGVDNGGLVTEFNR